MAVAVASGGQLDVEEGRVELLRGRYHSGGGRGAQREVRQEEASVLTLGHRRRQLWTEQGGKHDWVVEVSGGRGGRALVVAAAVFHSQHLAGVLGKRVHCLK